MDKLSVIMPAYNSEKYIDDSIKSILNQSYSNFECIIINDGSTDLTGEIIRKYMKIDKRIILLERENCGLVTSLNEGIALAKGKYIVRMDSDDISDKYRFEKQLKYLKTHVDVDIVGSYIEVIGEKKNAVEIEAWFNKTWQSEEAINRCQEGCIIAHPTAMGKAEVFKKLNGYRDKYPSFEDDDIWIRAIKSGYNISNIDETLLKYRVHNDSKSSKDSENYERFLYEKISFKLEHFFNNKLNGKIFIWGCGMGGRIAKKSLNDNNIKIEGFIDSMKEGTYEGKNIYKKDVLNTVEKVYVIIATKIGYEDVKAYLHKVNFNNYTYIL